MRLPRDRRTAWCLVGLIALTIAVYLPVRGNDFVAWDDQTCVYGNPQVREGLTWRSVGWAFSTFTSGDWNPLTWLSHMVDVQLFDVNAGAHHLVSAALHLANALLLFDVLRRMTGAPGRSFFVAALFAVHPLHVESVAWVAERKDVLSTLFWMLTLEAYVAWTRAPNARRYALVLLAFAAGLLSKPMLVTLPCTLLLLDWWPLARMTDAASARRLVVEKIPLFALAAASSVMAILAQREVGGMSTVESVPLGERAANSLNAYVGYLAHAVWPTGLSPVYARVRTTFDLRTLLAAAALAAFSALAVRESRRRPWLAVGWFWFLGTLVPVIGLVTIGAQFMADRFTYVPLVGVFVVAAWGAADLVGTERRRLAALGGAAALATLACAALARREVDAWRDTETLWRHALDVAPDDTTARSRLAEHLMYAGRLDEAAVEFREVVRLLPASAQARTNLGIVLTQQGRTDAAIAEFEEAVRLGPGFAAAHQNFGVALRQAGRIDEALREMSEAVRLAPDDAVARHALGGLLAATGDAAGAVREFDAVARLLPDAAPAHRDLAAALRDAGRLDGALREIEEALRLAPQDASCHAALASILERRGDCVGAVRELDAALRLDPGDQAARAERLRLTGR